MTERAQDRPARHVAVDVSEARIARLWGGISAGLEARRRPGRWLWVGALASVAVVALALAYAFRPRSAVLASASGAARLETAADTLSVTLADGSTVKLAPHSRVEVGDRAASAVRLVLERGLIECDVTHQAGRSFVVHANGVEVRVVGTHFSVATEPADGAIRVEVRVERGVVEVASAAEVARVEAGRTWSSVTKTAASAERGASSSAAPAVSGAAEPSAAKSAESAAIVPESENPAEPSARAPTPSHPSDARELFEQAKGLWREGRIAEAAQAYQSLLSTYPGDARAGLSAFELGRLRMDRLGDMPGAVRALERAVALAPGSGFREDAMARLVTAYARTHNLSGCERARDKYLREYATGVHRGTVSGACGSR